MTPFPINLKKVLHETERDFIEVALYVSSGNKASAARLLGMNRTTLVERMRAHKMKLNKPTRRK